MENDVIFRKENSGGILTAKEVPLVHEEKSGLLDLQKRRQQLFKNPLVEESIYNLNLPMQFMQKIW